MRYQKVNMLLLILSVAMCIFSMLFSANAQENSNLAERYTEGLSLTLLANETDKKVIQCFDVRNDGWFAVGYKGNLIHVYDQNGTFQYGYEFSCNGDYGVLFEGDTLCIYLVRDDVIVAYDLNGNCVYVKEIYFTNSILDNVIYKTKKQIGNTTYILERDVGIFQGDYSRLVSIDYIGKRTVLYDVTTWGIVVGMFHYLIIVIIGVGFVVGIWSNLKKNWYS